MLLRVGYLLLASFAIASIGNDQGAAEDTMWQIAHSISPDIMPTFDGNLPAFNPSLTGAVPSVNQAGANIPGSTTQASALSVERTNYGVICRTNSNPSGNDPNKVFAYYRGDQYLAGQTLSYADAIPAVFQHLNAKFAANPETYTPAISTSMNSLITSMMGILTSRKQDMVSYLPVPSTANGLDPNTIITNGFTRDNNNNVVTVSLTTLKQDYIPGNNGPSYNQRKSTAAHLTVYNTWRKAIVMVDLIRVKNGDPSIMNDPIFDPITSTSDPNFASAYVETAALFNIDANIPSELVAHDMLSILSGVIDDASVGPTTPYVVGNTLQPDDIARGTTDYPTAWNDVATSITAFFEHNAVPNANTMSQLTNIMDRYNILTDALLNEYNQNPTTGDTRNMMGLHQENINTIETAAFTEYHTSLNSFRPPGELDDEALTEIQAAANSPDLTDITITYTEAEKSALYKSDAIRLISDATGLGFYAEPSGFSVDANGNQIILPVQLIDQSKLQLSDPTSEAIMWNSIAGELTNYINGFTDAVPMPALNYQKIKAAISLLGEAVNADVNDINERASTNQGVSQDDITGATNIVGFIKTYNNGGQTYFEQMVSHDNGLVAVEGTNYIDPISGMNLGDPITFEAPPVVDPTKVGAGPLAGRSARMRVRSPSNINSLRGPVRSARGNVALGSATH